MRAILQRVSEAAVHVEGECLGAIGHGFLVLVGIEAADTLEDIQWLAHKIVNMRVFGDENGAMNLSVQDVRGNLLVISQFTLFAQTKKGNRPSFIRAAAPEYANSLYEKFVEALEQALGREVSTGKFGADMKVSLINDGPVTITIDTKARE